MRKKNLNKKRWENVTCLGSGNTGLAIILYVCARERLNKSKKRGALFALRVGGPLLRALPGERLLIIATIYQGTDPN